MKSNDSILIIGAGPAGLALAACLKKNGTHFRWVDRFGLPGGAYQRMYSETVLASPTKYTSLPGYALKHSGTYITAGQYRDYLTAYATAHDLNPEKTEVEQIDKVENSFAVKFKGSQKVESFKILVMATGMFDFPVMPEISGLKQSTQSSMQIIHAKDWQGSENLNGPKVLIVGGGTSAVEIAENCVCAGLKLTLSARNPKIKTLPQTFLWHDLHDYFYFLEKLPRWLGKSYCADQNTLPATDLGFKNFSKNGLIDIKPEIDHVDQNRVYFANGDSTTFDTIIFATGYHYGRPQLSFTLKTWPKSEIPMTRADGESVDCPNLYWIGIPCALRLNSAFLRGMAHDAPVMARTIQRKIQFI